MNAHTAGAGGERRAQLFKGGGGHGCQVVLDEHFGEHARTQKSSNFCRLATLVGEEEQTDGGVGGQGGHEDDEDDDGDVGFLCRKNSCSEHIYDNSAPSIRQLPNGQFQQREGRRWPICTLKFERGKRERCSQRADSFNRP